MDILIILILLASACALQGPGQNTNMNLEITGWNMRCNFDAAKPYMCKIMNTAHIIALSEHSLFPCEVQKITNTYPNHDFVAKSSSAIKDTEFGMRRGIGGCAILWCKSISHVIRPIPKAGTDRHCLIQVQANDQLTIYIIAVYMPHQTCKISDFKQELIELETLIYEFGAMGEVLVIGDTNVHLGRLSLTLIRRCDLMWEIIDTRWRGIRFRKVRSKRSTLSR